MGTKSRAGFDASVESWKVTVLHRNGVKLECYPLKNFIDNYLKKKKKSFENAFKKVTIHEFTHDVNTARSDGL